MTSKQIQQFNKMRATLIKISKQYQKPERLRKDSEKDWGLNYTEAMEMAYENIQTDAHYAVKGVKEIKLVSKPTENQQ